MRWRVKEELADTEGRVYPSGSANIGERFGRDNHDVQLVAGKEGVEVCIFGEAVYLLTYDDIIEHFEAYYEKQQGG